MISATARVIFAGLLASFFLLPLSGAKNDLQSASNAQFEIVGLHGGSVRYVDDLSRYIVEGAARYLDPTALQFPQRILVSLKPPEYVDFEGDYFVRSSNRGFVNVNLRWDESLALLTTCRALSEALLVRYSIFNHGQKGLGFLPKWPATAIGAKAYFSLRPAQSKRLIDWFELPSTPTVTSLLQRQWDDPVVDMNGYMFLLAMERSGLERRRVRNLMARSIAGENIAEALAALVQSNSPTEEGLGLDDWWRASSEQLLAAEEEPMETMGTSRAWIEALADLAIEEHEKMNLSRLWKERDNEALRDLVEARYEILRLRIVRVNPAYFNAARSLGTLFETYLTGDKRHEYIFRLTVFLGDFEDSKALEEKVAEALKSNQAGTKGSGE